MMMGSKAADKGSLEVFNWITFKKYNLPFFTTS